MSEGIRFHLRRVGIVALTALLAWAALLIGQGGGDPGLQLGEVSPRDFFASREVTVTDQVATEVARAEEAAAVAPVFEINPSVAEDVYADITTLFSAARAGVTAPSEPPAAQEVEFPPVTEPVAEEETTETTLPPAPGRVSGTVYLDVDGDATFGDGDVPFSEITVVLTPAEGTATSVTTDARGAFTGSVAAGPVLVDVNESDPRFPMSWTLSAGTDPQIVTVQPDEVTPVDAVGIAPLLRDAEVQAQELQGANPALAPATISKLVQYSVEDVVNLVAGQPLQLDAMRDKTIQRAESLFLQGIKPTDLTDAKNSVLLSPPVIFITEPDLEANNAAADILALLLQANSFENEEKTQAARDEASAAVPDVPVTYQPDQLIVSQGQTLEQKHIDALDSLGVLRRPAIQALALLSVVAVIVTVLSFYLVRFRPLFWSNARRVALFGLLVVLAAIAAAGTAVVTGGEGNGILADAGGYLIPAAAFGLMAAILFDARIGVLMAVAVAALAGIAVRDPGVALFALLSAMAPIPLVSSISTRRDIGRAVATTAVAVTAVAVPIAWFFHGAGVIRDAVIMAAINGLVFSGPIAVTLVAFLESIFDVTTSLRLLDLTDRNSAALQLLQEEAWGTFNHSLMVGTLADKAARSIGANNLLARAAAYYHDLGKTENPTFFIENQFGISNPHDRLPPSESAEIIRQHVIDGRRLARKYRIPSEVAEGIDSHHGDGVMRYFYQKAKERYGEDNVDPADYRHEGHKPRSREMAILMLADALEGACRAVFQDEDPSPEAIRRVVETVVGEKVADGQLSDSALTLGELTLVKAGFVDALVGHYHQRIPYPNFPEVAETPSPVAAANTGAEPPATAAPRDRAADTTGGLEAPARLDQAD